MVQAAGVTDRGRVRPINEDCFGIDPELQLYVVADGMGGHAAGEVASRLAVEAVLDYVGSHGAGVAWPDGHDRGRPDRVSLMRLAVEAANARVHESAAASLSYSGMGTTVVAALVTGGLATIAHVGDSRLYAVRDGQIDQVTDDDSWAAAMLAREPALDPAVLRTHPMRHALTSVIGARPAVAVHVAERRLQAGDLLVLTTDGVHGALPASALVRACANGDQPHDIATRLVQAALAGGSRDNCTAVVVRYEGS